MNRTLPLWPVFVALMLAGCTGKEENWHGKDISGLMPELEFQLQGTNGQPVTAAGLSGSASIYLTSVDMNQTCGL